ncbi:MAG TPA: ABC transporter permease [Spirochaetales bacterium]|nr:ABC transporter permease [Spirochaetales bacterium]HRY54708.1 ABC transporter permease [Spirochaetia bacterium]
MSKVLAVAKRELRSSFNSPVAYAVILGFLVFTSAWLYFVRGFIAANQADLRPYFGVMPIVLAFLAPALTMRSWAEERRLGTYELLLTMPFTEGQLVAGKFLASLAVAALALLLSLPVPLSASLLGSFDAGVIAAQYLGILLEAAAALAVGQWVSSLAKNQVSAFLGGVLLLLALVLVDRIAAFLQIGGLLASLLNWLSLAFHFDAFSRGVVDTRDLAYFAAVSAAALYLSSWNLSRRKWS